MNTLQSVLFRRPGDGGGRNKLAATATAGGEGGGRHGSLRPPLIGNVKLVRCSRLSGVTNAVLLYVCALIQDTNAWVSLPCLLASPGADFNDTQWAENAV